MFCARNVQANAVQSEPQTTSVPSNSASASFGKNQLNPTSINQTEKMLDTFSQSKTLIATSKISTPSPQMNGY